MKQFCFPRCNIRRGLLTAIIKVSVISRVGRNRTRIVVSYKTFAILREVWLTCNNPRATGKLCFETTSKPPFHPTAFQPSANSCPSIDSTSNRTTAYKLTPEWSDFFPSLLEEPTLSRWEQVKLTHGIPLSPPPLSILVSCISFFSTPLHSRFDPPFRLAPFYHRKSFIWKTR